MIIQLKGSVKRIITVILLLGMAFSLLTACGGIEPQPSIDVLFSATPSFTPTPTVVWFPITATPEARIVPTGTPNPAENPIYGLLILSDEGAVRDHWPSLTNAAGSITADQNSLTLAVNSARGLQTVLREDTTLTNFYFESVMTVNLCKTGDQMGVLFRVKGSQSYYRFLVSCEGKIALYQVAGGEPNAIKDWTLTGQVQPGLTMPLKIGVWAFGDTLRIYLNDQLQLEAENSTFLDGGIGFYAKAGGDTSVAVNFSQIKIYDARK